MKKFIFIIVALLISSCAVEKNKNNYEYYKKAKCSHILDSNQRKVCEEIEYNEVKIIEYNF